MKLRIERWLRHSNGPLVTALTEHESILDQLATAQELRVKSANEVVVAMKLIAGTAARIIHCPLPCLNLRFSRLVSGGPQRILNRSRESARS